MQLTRASNPYSAGAGTMPPFLAGRDKDVERFEALLERLEAGEHGRSLIYSGLRGVGGRTAVACGCRSETSVC